ncbi:MAG: DUF2306 domain-containing protein [Cytophagales bacterium]|jgi:uncharacterized membrane protein|nr:DUF2306 domain-containing protein [Cytophagales bacterium]MCA6373732.1 DUF2306 domain-containing protein [Cytophagales bacterium]MCA6377373.1 DUF2306 domain-containing protein [Cytophagales bacterium]MCA6384539.1 DUF2306 domain-containing protein [Cytophagales bacterium]
MEIEKATRILIYSHAFLGGIALFSGMVSLIAKKGKTIHRKSGKVFLFSMLSSALTALIISVLPNHESAFLFSIGVFSSYLILTGYRAISYKSKNVNLTIDKIISWTMIVLAFLMMFYNPIFNNKVNIVLTVFGIVGLFLSIRDLILYKNIERLTAGWLKLHLGKMIGGYISATTAFVVVNDFFPSFYGWFIPGIIGGFYITYWMNKLKSKA